MPADGRWWDSVEAVRAFAAELDDTPAEDRVGLVTFSNPADDAEPGVRTRREVTVTGRYDGIARRLHRIGRSYGGRATHIAAGIRAGLRTLRDSPGTRRNSEKVLVVMTDGNPDDPGEIPIAAGEAAAARVRIYAVTFGPDTDLDLMGRMAGATGGRAWHGEDPSALAEAYREIARTVPTILID